MHGSKVDHRIIQLDQLRQPAHGNRRVSKGPGSNVLLPKPSTAGARMIEHLYVCSSSLSCGALGG